MTDIVNASNTIYLDDGHETVLLVQPEDANTVYLQEAEAAGVAPPAVATQVYVEVVRGFAEVSPPSTGAAATQVYVEVLRGFQPLSGGTTFRKAQIRVVAQQHETWVPPS